MLIFKGFNLSKTLQAMPEGGGFAYDTVGWRFLSLRCYLMSIFISNFEKEGERGKKWEGGIRNKEYI